MWRRVNLKNSLEWRAGYVLDFSNRTFAEFVRDSTGRDIYDSHYDYGSGSKANRLRAFWQKEENDVVGKLMSDLLDYSDATGPPEEVCRLIVARLLQKSSGPREDSGSQQKEQLSQQQRRSQVLRQLKEYSFSLFTVSEPLKIGPEAYFRGFRYGKQ